MMRSRLGRSRRSGFGLIDLMIAVLVLGLLFGSIAAVGRTSTQVYRTGTVSVDVDARLRRTMDRIVRELISSGLHVLVPDPQPPIGSETLDYLQSAGVASGAILWGEPRRIAFEYELGEVDDGIDNNGNGSIDEGAVVLTIDVGGPNERRVVLCHGVREYLEGEVPNGLDDDGNGLRDEKGLSFSVEGGHLAVRLTVERRDEDGRPITRTIETSVKPRNSREVEP
jgi:hypothetical protein